jgi:hypothetical protein
MTTHFSGDVRSDNGFYSTDGYNKFHNHACTEGYAVEIKSDPVIVTGTHFGAEITVDATPSTATSAAGIRGVGGIGRLAATYTMTDGSLIGSYGQACNLGTLNGSGIFMAGSYSLLEDGGTFTAVSHVSGLWVDSHLTKTITAGLSELAYLTNNGTTTLDNALYVYAGNKITNLFTIDTASGMVSDATTADYTFTKTRKVKVVVGGETGYLIVDIV